MDLRGMVAPLAVVLLCLSAIPAHPQATTPGSRPPLPGAPAGVTAFEHVAVVPMDRERILTDETVLIQRGWITALGPADSIRIPPGATRIDGRGRYLIPGLSDMHAHLPMEENGQFHSDTANLDGYAEHLLLLWLANGATTVRLMDYGWPVWGREELRLKACQAAGQLLSPRIYNTGPWGPLQYLNMLGAPDPPPRVDSIASYVAVFKAAGYDFIKPYFESPQILDSLLAAAHRVGLPVSGHVPVGTTIERAIQEGYTGIEHEVWEWASDSIDWAHPDTLRVRALAETMRRHGVWNIPTLAHYEGKILEHQHGGPERWALDRWLAKTFQNVGVGLLLGTDNPAGIGLHLELQALVAAGLTPYQALLTGTRNVAQYFGTLEESGTVSVGKRADLVLLAENPLADIRNTTAIVGVMLGGRWLPRAFLDQRAQQTAQGVDSPAPRCPPLPPH